MALTVIENATMGAIAMPDGSIHIATQDQDTGEKYVVPFNKEGALSVAKKIQEVASGVKVHSADEMPDGP